MTQQEFAQIGPSLPGAPGIYKYYDAAGRLLYVGKARDIRKRVSSYFSKTLTSYKTHELVKRIHRIEFTIVNSEQDAFLLENSLIKEFQPKFNINLRDDKTYPYIVIRNEPFPRVYLTRQKEEDGSLYLGPYTSVGKVRELLDFIRNTVPLRTCALNLTPRNIEKGKFRVCLEYHLGNCKGPCEGLQSEEDYQENILQVRNFLRGNLSPVIRHFRREMDQYAAGLDFEKAELVRKRIAYLENYQARSIVANTSVGNVDVFYGIREQDAAYVNYLMVQNGAIIQTKTVRLQTHLDETLEEILAFTIGQFRTTFNSIAGTVIVQTPLEYEEPDVVLVVPRGGEKKKLLDLSEKNVRYFIDSLRAGQRLKLGVKSAGKYNLLLQLQQDLKLAATPVHIECFDNSNFQGAYPVSAMVAFRNGEPSKKDYRLFNIRSVEGINDFASMKEAVYRRYKRLKDEGQPFPQLVIVDGGKGQLNAAGEALAELEITGSMTLVGLAKQEEEIFFPGDSESLKLPFDSDSLRFIRMVRDEVHRFGINFHRGKRSRGTFRNELEDIRGIGKATAESLLRKFRSVKNIREADMDELAKLVGPAKALLIRDYFDSRKNKGPG